MNVVGYVPGGFDLFHIGHLNILRAARARCDFLIAGVATDQSLIAMKGHPPVIPFEERLQIVSSVSLVDRAVADHSQEKRIAWLQNQFYVHFNAVYWRVADRKRHVHDISEWSRSS